MYILKIIFLVIFILINIFIIYTDIKEKKIKNKYILLLILLFPIFIILFPYFKYNLVDVIIFSILIITLITFYSKNHLPAWDIKYIIILSLYSQNYLFWFIWNISIIIILKILINYIFFIFSTIYNNIWKKPKLIQNINIFIKNIGLFLLQWITIYIISSLIFYLLKDIIFLNNNNFLKWLITLLIIYIWVSIYYIFSKKINKKLYYLKFLIPIILYLIYIINIIYWNLNVSLSLLFNFFIIFSVFKFFLKSLMYMIQKNEEVFIDIKKLKVWNIVDKKFLIKIYWKYSEIQNYLISKKIIKSKDFFENFKNPINNETKDKIQNIYYSINKKNLDEKNEYTQFFKIKIKNTFSFGPYIFVWFFIAYIIKFDLLIFSINFIKNIFKF
jgi:Flp pilus assembly protein protease CpaA